MPRTVLHVVPHTHWDREWYEPLEVYRFQLVKVVDRLLEVLDTDPAFRHFNFDGQTAAIEDYLEVRAAVEPEVKRFVEAGRLAVGPWRILMDEFLCSPETIIRNLRQGRTMAERLGGSMRIGYIPDSFGHVSQMPQILSLAGFTDACVWRGVPEAVGRAAFRWEAPDGSSVRAIYLARSYSNGASLPETFEELIVRAKRIVEDMHPFDPGDVVLAMNGTDHRGPEAHLPALFADANARQDEISFRIGSMTEYLRDAPSADLPVWRGEMRSGARANLLMGVISARMPLKQLEFAAATMLERYAEPLAAIAGTDAERILAKPWRGMVENSAHDSICGCGVDAVADAVAARYREAHRVGDLVAHDALETLAGRIDAPRLAEGDEGVVVFNPSPFERSGVAEVSLTLPGRPEECVLETPDGVPHAVQPLEVTDQVIVDMKLRGSELARLVPSLHSRLLGPMYVNALDIEESPATIRLRMAPVPIGDFDVEAAKRRVESLVAARPNGRFHVIGMGPPLCRLLVHAGPVAGLGWTLLTPRAGRAALERPTAASGRTLTNEHLRATVRDDGTVDLEHLATGKTFPGLLALRDGGDAGDEYNYSPPERDVFVRPSDPADVEVIRPGPVEARIRVRTKLRVPGALAANRRARARRTVTMPVAIELSLRMGEPFLRASIRVGNSARDHRLRAHFPLPFTATWSHADGAFDVVERGLEAEGGFEVGLPTFPCRRWVDASDGDSGLAILHLGTPEYELAGGDEIALTLLRCVGWLSRQDLSTRSGPAGPALETPGAQLPGEHLLRLAIHPHAGDWRAGRVQDAAELFALPLRSAGVRGHAGDLPPGGGALTVDPPDVRLSSLATLDGRTECRVYNTTGAQAEARLTVAAPLGILDPAKFDLFGGPIEPLAVEGDHTIVVPLRSWEIATVRIS
ncbi:MAG TPA: glycoside hydrolase family 38 C-terminal domain-containing protein [Actinomycetota bacterium]|nr:glycoside hydrolase family 38 C-terminal domain-containing protein [Actinomycetota bacterium]